MTTLRKIFSKKKAKKLKDNILDFDLRNLLVIKSLLILIFISTVTFTFIFYSFLGPIGFVMIKNLPPILVLPAWFILFFPSRYLFRKFMSQFKAVKEEYKTKGYFKNLSNFLKKIF